MRALLSSPRRRRRLVWLGGVLLVVAAAVGVGIKFPNTAPRHEETPVGKPNVYREPKAVRPSASDQKEALATAVQFVETAVRRKHVGESWALTAPSLREGFTRRQWATQDIPVVPYPARSARWRLDYSYEDTLGFAVVLLPGRRARIQPAVFNMELEAVGSGKQRRWLVNYWAPASTVFPARRTRSASPAGPGLVGEPALARAPGKPALGAGWLFVPLALFGLLVLVPLAIAGRGLYRGVRARRSYEAGRRLPELPRGSDAP